jgi:hypothetical protein
MEAGTLVISPLVSFQRQAAPGNSRRRFLDCPDRLKLGRQRCSLVVTRWLGIEIGQFPLLRSYARSRFVSPPLGFLL